jgi:hypothetical protein
MSSIGTSALTCIVSPDARTLWFDGDNWSRQGLVVTITGHARAPTDLLLAVRRRGILVASLVAGTITGTTALATGTLDTNTVELENSMVGLLQGDVVRLQVELWDTNIASLELIGTGEFELHCSGPLYGASVAVPVTPLTGSTGSLGNLGWKSGATYWRNDDVPGPNNWFPVTLRGAAGEMFIDYTAPGVSIP